MTYLSNDLFLVFFFVFGVTVRTCVLRITQSLKISPSHPELPPAELFSFAYKLLRVFFCFHVSQFYMRNITLTTVRVTIRLDLLRLAAAPFVRLPLCKKQLILTVIPLF